MPESRFSIDLSKQLTNTEMFNIARSLVVAGEPDNTVLIAKLCVQSRRWNPDNYEGFTQHEIQSMINMYLKPEVLKVLKGYIL